MIREDDIYTVIYRGLFAQLDLDKFQSILECINHDLRFLLMIDDNFVTVYKDVTYNNIIFHVIIKQANNNPFKRTIICCNEEEYKRVQYAIPVKLRITGAPLFEFLHTISNLLEEYYIPDIYNSIISYCVDIDRLLPEYGFDPNTTGADWAAWGRLVAC